MHAHCRKVNSCKDVLAGLWLVGLKKYTHPNNSILDAKIML